MLHKLTHALFSPCMSCLTHIPLLSPSPYASGPRSLLLLPLLLLLLLRVGCCSFFVLKPENLLLVDKKDDANLKIADFGFAKKHDSHTEVLKTQCGTPGCETNHDLLIRKITENSPKSWLKG